MKINFTLFLSSFILVAFISNVQAQGTTITANSIEVGIYERSEAYLGSPYFSEEWMDGAVVLADGKKYEKLHLKFDQLTNQVVFLDQDLDKIQAFKVPVTEFILISKLVAGNDTKFRSDYPSIDGSNASSFFEVLTEGKTQLLKRTIKVVVEERPDNSLLLKKMIKASTRYYLKTGSTLARVKNNEKEVLILLKDKQAELKAYIKENKLNLKQDNDLAKLFDYYNSII